MAAPNVHTTADAELKEFVSVVLADTEDVWNAEFERLGKVYEEPNLVLFTDRVDSACGLASSAVGPFYCPADAQIYLDLSFLRDMKRQLGAAGDFAQAYVIAHEVGHHVQHLLGLTDRVERSSPAAREGAAGLSVRTELQADFLAGLWARRTQDLKDVLEPGDLEEALNAAAAIGDDRLQKMTRGTVMPDSFTHGTSAQRVKWFRKGYDSGDLSQGDTFSKSARQL
jgi:predicted metalloprotease